jgi:hypothetical protein
MINSIIKIGVAAIVIIGVFFMLGTSFIGSAGNALLSSVNGTASAHGLAQIVPASQPNKSDLQVRLDGLPANQTYGVSLNRSGCSGSTLQYVGTLTTDSNGSIVQDFPLSNLSTSSQDQIWLNVHQNNGANLVCGQVQVNQNLLPQVVSSTTNATVGNNGLNAFPQTGVAPGKHSSYRNHVFPRKY